MNVYFNPVLTVHFFNIHDAFIGFYTRIFLLKKTIPLVVISSLEVEAVQFFQVFVLSQAGFGAVPEFGPDAMMVTEEGRSSAFTALSTQKI